ncbi:MAG: glycerate kinase [Leadbetterella sp.]
MNRIKNILVVPDSFKESLSSLDVCKVIQAAVEGELKNVQVKTLPLADGGEGSLEAIENSISSQRIYLTAKNALGEPIDTFYLKSADTAFIEMAKVNGLEQIAVEKRNPLLTSTFGTGQIIKHALENGAKKLIVFIGGSATNDGGVGMAQALGIAFKNSQNQEIALGGQFLGDISSIDWNNSILKKYPAEIVVACDVKNPLLGENGATYTFSKQKGANPDMQKILESGLENLVKQVKNSQNHTLEGAGAAGGLGYGLITFADARIQKGFDVIANVTGLEEHIKTADMVITGEGSFDAQSLQGKVPYSLGILCKKYQKPLIVLAGNVELSDNLEEYGISAVFPIVQGITNLENAKAQAAENLSKTVKNICKIINLNML